MSMCVPPHHHCFHGVRCCEMSDLGVPVGMVRGGLLFDKQCSVPLFFKRSNVSCVTVSWNICTCSKHMCCRSLVGQIGCTPNATADTDTKLGRSDLCFTQNETANFFFIPILSDRLVLHQMPRHGCTHLCRSDLWCSRTETAHVLVDVLIVGQTGSTKCLDTHAHIFVDLSCGTHKLRRHMCSSIC